MQDYSDEDVERIRASGLFDEKWYLQEYPDVKSLGMDPVEHYLWLGRRLGRKPSGESAAAADLMIAGGSARQFIASPVTRAARSPASLAAPDAPSPRIARFHPPASMSDAELERLLDIEFPVHVRPAISIIVPVFNQIGYTAVCLRALVDQLSSDTFEVIVMDDGSSDRTQELVSRVPGIVYHRNPANLGFNRNCNRGAEIARGEYLVFLNNDTEVLPGWLQALSDTFRHHGDVGLAGSKLIYPDGRLQEAGGIVWNDGSGWNWGRLKHPAHPRYNFVRDVDYISGASIMVPRELFFRLGAFASELENSYYEDTWLAFAVREAGLRVVYQPRSQLIHFEGVTSGRSETEGTKRYQVSNREAFRTRWRSALAGNLANGSDPETASDRMPRGHILIVDACTPTPDQDSGSVDMFNLIRILRSMNYRVHFIPQSNFLHFGAYTERLEQMGVECIYGPFYNTVRDFLSERRDMFSHVFLARTPVAEAVIATVEELAPSAKKLFYTVDMHGLREVREAKLSGDVAQLRRAEDTLRRELGLVERSDTAIVLSEFEAEFLREQGHRNVAVVPLIRDYASMPHCPPFDEREGVAFIGGFQHTPNLDAVRWLYDEIWPHVRELAASRGMSPIRLKVVGSKMPDWIRQEAAPDVDAIGFVQNLDDVFQNVRLSVAPLRYAAGLKGKVATSLEYGVPVVGTSTAFEGMPSDGLEAIHNCADTAEGIAEQIVTIYSGPQEWFRVSEGGKRYVKKHYSLKTISNHLISILGG